MLRNQPIFWTTALMVAGLLTACGGGGEQAAPAYPQEIVEEGKTLFLQTCFACHGQDGKGLPNLGKDLTTSEFVQVSTDDELLAYVQDGREADDPANTTGVAMPPKGGFDFLTDDDILRIIAFIRSIQR